METALSSVVILIVSLIPKMIVFAVSRLTQKRNSQPLLGLNLTSLNSGIWSKSVKVKTILPGVGQKLSPDWTMYLHLQA